MKRSKFSQILAGVLVNSLYETKNYPIVLLSSVITPFSILIVITFVSHGTLFGTAILGGLIMTFFTSGISLQSDLSHLKNDFKLQDMIVSSPTSARLYMGGMDSCRNCLFYSLNCDTCYSYRDLPGSLAPSSSHYSYRSVLDVRRFRRFRVHARNLLKRCCATLRLLPASSASFRDLAASLLPYNLYSFTTQLPRVLVPNNLCR